ncbi:nucleotidyltransferase family protein [bacterium]|nr:nucleotidyltransferase family protein [bacterium]
MRNNGVIGIVLAAGRSRRTGERHKLTLPIGGRTVIEHTVCEMLAACGSVIVVLGYNPVAIKKILGKYDGVKFVLNEHYDDGMFTSVKAGISVCNGDKIFITPGDYPLIRRYVYEKMLDVVGDIVVPRYNGRNGHPVLLRGEIAAKIIDEPDSSNLKIFINKMGYKTIEIDDEGIILDIDTMEDYENVRSIYERKNFYVG